MSADEDLPPTRLESDVAGVDEDADEQERTIPDGGDIDWQQVWDDAGCGRERHMSNTQLGVAIEVSDATGAARNEHARRLIREAVEAGGLEERRSLTPKESEEARTIVSGYYLGESG